MIFVLSSRFCQSASQPRLLVEFFFSLVVAFRDILYFASFVIVTIRHYFCPLEPTLRRLPTMQDCYTKTNAFSPPRPPAPFHNRPFYHGSINHNTKPRMPPCARQPACLYPMVFESAHSTSTVDKVKAAAHGFRYGVGAFPPSFPYIHPKQQKRDRTQSKLASARSPSQTSNNK